MANFTQMEFGQMHDAVSKFTAESGTMANISGSVSSDLTLFQSQTDERVSKLKREMEDVQETDNFLINLGNKIQSSSEENKKGYNNSQNKTNQNQINVRQIISDYQTQSTDRVNKLKKEIGNFETSVRNMKTTAEGLGNWAGASKAMFVNRFEEIHNNAKVLQGVFEQINSDIKANAGKMEEDLELLKEDFKLVSDFLMYMEEMERKFAQTYLEKHENVDASLKKVGNFLVNLQTAETTVKEQTTQGVTDLIKQIDNAQLTATQVADALNKTATKTFENDQSLSKIW